MPTAVIVSGIMRNMANASTSWKFDADYFLHVDNKITIPQSRDVVGYAVDKLSENLKQCSVEFITATIDLDPSIKFTPEILARWHHIDIHPIFNMLWRWKCVYNQIKLYNTSRNYTKILILRPDLWLFNKADISLFDSMQLEPYTVYTTAELMHDSHRNTTIMGDTMLMTDFATFEILAKFFDYYVTNYARTVTHNGDDIHSMLARYVLDNNLAVNARLGDIFDFSILRDNSNHMFNAQGLMPEYSPMDLLAKQTEWWNEKYK